MKTFITFTLVVVLLSVKSEAQSIIKFDTALWQIDAEAYVIERYEGYQSLYLKSGSITVRDLKFLNGTIEYDIYLKNERGFPGIYFRQTDPETAEHFYIRPHLSGKPDANQVIPIIGGISAWQLYFGPKYSFPYDYAYDRWTHVMIKVLDNRAQLFLDWSEVPHHSWELFHEPEAGDVIFSGGDQSGLHLANIKIDPTPPELSDFEPKQRKPISDVVSQWTVSAKFEEEQLNDLSGLGELISSVKWLGELKVDEGVAANISHLVTRFDGTPGNTVLAKIVIDSNRDQTKLFHFGYSDRAIAILNGQPIYAGNNRFMSRDYRYLGTIGLFDAIYLNLKKGTNTLIFAVSEDFGGWLITGKFADQTGLKIN